jgi:Rrf2 family protein
MLKLGKKVEYALIAMVHLAENGSERLASAGTLATDHDLPPEIVGKVLQRLAKAGLVESVRGINGGYRLTKPISEIDLRSVIEAVDGPVKVVPCAGGGSCPQESGCSIREPVSRFQGLLLDFLYSIRLDALVDRDACARARECTPETCLCS